MGRVDPMDALDDAHNEIAELRAEVERQQAEIRELREGYVRKQTQATDATLRAERLERVRDGAREAHRKAEAERDAARRAIWEYIETHSGAAYAKLRALAGGEGE